MEPLSEHKIDAAFALFFWVAAVVTGFAWFAVFWAALSTLRFLLYETKAYRLVTHGWSWNPSKSPHDYR